ncbi:hypothetical protein MASR2M47_21170 [Draconibacterium sp.]
MYYLSNSGNNLNSDLTIIQSWKTLAKVNYLLTKSVDQKLFNKVDKLGTANTDKTLMTVSNPITFGAKATNETTACQTAEGQDGTERIKTFLFVIQGNNLRTGDETVLSKFDIVVLQRFNYDDIRGGTYSAIKKINPDTKIFLYQLGPWCATKDDGPTVVYMRSIGRYNYNKGHSMGNLNTNNSDFFLLDSNSKKINVPAFPNDYLLDFGSKKLIDYWIEATTNDIIGQAWEADGLFLDVTVPIISPYLSRVTNSLSYQFFVDCRHEQFYKFNCQQLFRNQFNWRELRKFSI